MKSVEITADSPTVRPAATPHAGTAQSNMAHKAFWVMTRRVTLMAAGVDLTFLALFLFLNAPLLAWLNIVSIALYGSAYWLLTRRINMPAVFLIWVEVLGHAAIGTLLIGWDSGFHYYLLMFIPAIIVSAGKSIRPFLLLLLLFIFYIGLHTTSQLLGPLEPLNQLALWAVHAFNVAVVFAMAAYTARFYYGTVRRAERKLVELAATDPLTGLSNRRNLRVLAEQVLAQARRAGQPTALVIVDIDNFKHTNDQYGHEVGDQVLMHIGTLLSTTCRAQDIVARWGGEEFLILLPNTQAGDALMLAERLRHAAATQPLLYANQAIAPTISLGVAELDAEEALDSAIARADQALYRRKDEGRNRVTAAE